MVKLTITCNFFGNYHFLAITIVLCSFKWKAFQLMKGRFAIKKKVVLKVGPSLSVNGVALIMGFIVV